MTAREAAALKVGDRVTFGADAGTVTDQGYGATTVTYDDGQVGNTDHRDMQDFARITTEPRATEQGVHA